MSVMNAGVRALLCLLCLFSFSGCTVMAVTGAVVGAATAVAVEVVEVPFEIAAGVHDAVTDDEEEAGEDE
jgi:hypothetical protein